MLPPRYLASFHSSSSRILFYYYDCFPRAGQPIYCHAETEVLVLDLLLLSVQPADVADSPQESRMRALAADERKQIRFSKSCLCKRLQLVEDEVPRSTTIAIRIEDDAIVSQKITAVLRMGNVDLMLEVIEVARAFG